MNDGAQTGAGHTPTLLPCPFCGATPHHGLGKVQHCSLHGDPYQHYSVWCPSNCAKKTAADKERAFALWNTRAADSHAEMLAALKVAREYMNFSLGSTYDGPNPYPIIDTAIANAERAETEGK